MKNTIIKITLLIVLFGSFLVAGDRQELTQKRTYKSKTYLNEDGSYTTILNTGYLHYKNEDGQFVDINKNFVPSDKPRYQYMVEQGLYKAYIKRDISNGVSVKFETRDGASLRTKLWGVAYLDMSTKQYHILQRTQSSLAEVNGDEVLYRNVFNHVDVKYMYTDKKLKEEIYLTQLARESLPNPQQFGMDPQHTFLVFITRMKFDSIRNHMYAQHVNITDATFESDERINFRDLKGDIKYFLPVDVAFPESERDSVIREHEHKIRRRLIKKNGKRFLLSGLPLRWLNQVPGGTIVFDPQVQIQPDDNTGQDSFVYMWEGSSTEGRTTNYSRSAYMRIDTWTKSGIPKRCRGFIQFDLSGLPAGATLTSAQFNTYWPDLGHQHAEGYAPRYTISSTYLKRVTEPWDESTLIWNNQPSFTSDNQVAIAAPTTGTSDFSADVTQLVKDMLKEGNYGFEWQPQVDHQYRRIYVGSSEHQNPAKRPQLVLNYTAGQVNYYIKDHLGNIRVTEDQDKNIVSAEDFYPFGLTMPGRSYNNGNTDSRFKFTGKELDEDLNINLYYFGARYYDPALGKWTSVDPLADKYVSYSPYNYSMNDPVNKIDPDGRGPDGFLDKIMAKLGFPTTPSSNGNASKNYELRQANATIVPNSDGASFIEGANQEAEQVKEALPSKEEVSKQLDNVSDTADAVGVSADVAAVVTAGFPEVSGTCLATSTGCALISAAADATNFAITGNDKYLKEIVATSASYGVGKFLGKGMKWASEGAESVKNLFTGLGETTGILTTSAILKEKEKKKEKISDSNGEEKQEDN